MAKYNPLTINVRCDFTEAIQQLKDLNEVVNTIIQKLEIMQEKVEQNEHII